jgi:putative membrane protein
LSRSLLTFIRGFCMGAADIVPGVSGGTIALVFGIYERLLDNVRRGAKAIGALLRADLGGVGHHPLPVP